MVTVSYGIRIPAIGELEHLGNISIGDIESITFREMGSWFPCTVAGTEARNFWQINSGEVVEWTGSYWRGRIGKFGTLIVRVTNV